MAACLDCSTLPPVACASHRGAHASRLVLMCILSAVAANNTGLESDLARKSADTMAQASKFNLDAAAIAFYNGATSELPSQVPSPLVWDV